MNDTLYSDKTQTYKKYIKDAIRILASDFNEIEISDREVDEIVEFEKRLANIIVKDEDRKNITILYNPGTLEQLTKEISFVKQ